VTKAIATTRALPADTNYNKTKQRARVFATLAGAEPIARNRHVTQAIATTMAFQPATKERARVLATLAGSELIARIQITLVKRRVFVLPMESAHTRGVRTTRARQRMSVSQIALQPALSKA
jgi:hypothetical protein